MYDFTSKKLIENPVKSKISCTFEVAHKKVVKELYENLNVLADLDSITIQELND